MLKKKWKVIKGYNYKISNYGEVYSLYSKRNIKPFVTNGKSLWIELQKKGISVRFNLSKLVVKYFNKNWTLEKQYALHVDYNRENNIETNLECTTRGDLYRYWYRFRNQTRGIYRFPNGKKRFRAVLKVKDKTVTIGYFKQKNEALIAYYSAYIGLYDIEPFTAAA